MKKYIFLLFLFLIPLFSSCNKPVANSNSNITQTDSMKESEKEAFEIPIENEPFEKVIKENCYFYSSPDENSKKGFEIESGTIIHLMSEYENWYKIELLRDDERYKGEKWIIKSETMDIEGIPNPFQSRREAMKEDLLKTFRQADKIELGALATGETYAYIDGDKIEKFIKLIKDGDIGTYLNNDSKEEMPVRAELVITSGDDKQTLVIGDKCILYFPTEKWMQNQNCLLFKDPSTYDKIKELFEIYPDEDTINANNWKPTAFETLNNFEGVSMSIKKETVSSSKLTLVFKNSSNRQCIYGEEFTLEKKLNGKWYQVPVSIVGDYAFHSIGYNLSPGEMRELPVDWEWLYGNLAPGKYRIVKNILDFRETGDYDSYNISSEFSIN